MWHGWYHKAAGCRWATFAAERQATGGGIPSALRGQVGVPAAHGARVADRRAGELERVRMWVWADPDVVPVEDVLAEGCVPPRRGGDSVASANPSGGGYA